MNGGKGKKIDWHFEKLSAQERQNLALLWEHLRNDDYKIHTFNKDGCIRSLYNFLEVNVIIGEITR